MMSSEHSEGHVPEISIVPQQKLPRLLLLILVFALGIGVRLYRVTEPLLEFHAMRQYRAALIAHGTYARIADDMPEAERELAINNATIQGQLEPPIMETLAALTYRVVGMHLWVPRIYSILFWSVGGLFLFLLGRRVLSEDEALVAIGFYFFVPFGITASRTFQPDSLMVMLYLAGLYSIWRYHEHPEWRWLIAAGLFSGAAVFVKPLVLYALLISFILLELRRQSSLRDMINRSSVVFATLMFVPIFAFYGFNLLSNPALQANARAQFIPRLLTTQSFWVGWFQQIDLAVGMGMVVIGLLGVVLVKARPSQVFLAGLWLSYALFGVTFTYLVSTHNYYQLHFIPLVGLSISPVVVSVIHQVQRRFTLNTTRMALTFMLVLVVFSLGASAYFRRRALNTYGAISTRFLEYAEDIRERTEGSRRVVSLSEGYSLPLWYHARITGSNWPTSVDVAAADYRGEAPIYLDQVIDENLAQGRYDYFVVTNMPEFVRQSQVRDYAYDNLPVLEETDGYIIFDLKSNGDDD